MALKGIKVIEFSGLAPGPMCGMILSDFGAQVTIIDRIAGNKQDVLRDGKRKIALDIKSIMGRDLIKSLSKTSDVIIDPYRPGVLEKLGLGPDELFKDNKRLIYARLTGFGQNGPFAHVAGHDINYMAMSGILSMLGRKNEKPNPPINYGADFAGGGLLCALGICMALLSRHNSNKGQIVDSSMTEGAAYVGSWLMRSQNQPWWGNKRGENMLDSGAHFYEIYETKDRKYMAVGSIEQQFYQLLLKGLELSNDVEQFGDYESNKEIFRKKFLTKTQTEWCKIFDHTDACVTPVLDWNDAQNHPHSIARNMFFNQKNKENCVPIPNPSPKLSLTPGISSASKENKTEFEDAIDIFKDIGLTTKDIKRLYEENILYFEDKPKL